MKTAIVTGAAGNLGKAVVQAFLDGNYHVVAVDTHPVDIDHTELEMKSADLKDEVAVDELVNNLITQRGSIDVLVCTAGGFAMGKVAGTKWKDIEQQFSLNFQTAYNLARPVFREMIKAGSGRIFFIGSRPGSDMKQAKGMVGYALSKSLLFRLAELMNDEAKGTDVVAAVIAPSTIDTPQNRKSMPNADPKKWVRPEEIANIIYFYCTESASAIRETVIKVYKNA